MNILFTLLQAAPAAGAQQGGASSMSFWLMMIAIFAIMYFFMIRPQRKQQKELEKFRSELKKGDKVVTAGGIYGILAETPKPEERTVLLKVDGETKLRVDKSSIQRDFTETSAPSANSSAPTAAEEKKPNQSSGEDKYKKN